MDTCALNAIFCSKTFSSAPSVQPMGAACDGWLPGRGRFPPIGGRPGNTAATTLPAATDSRLTSFSQEQSSLPFQTRNNLNQDERGSGRKKAEDQWSWPLQSTYQHGGRWGEHCMLHVEMQVSVLYPTQGWSKSRCKLNPVSTAKFNGFLYQTKLLAALPCTTYNVLLSVP